MALSHVRTQLPRSIPGPSGGRTVPTCTHAGLRGGCCCCCCCCSAGVGCLYMSIPLHTNTSPLGSCVPRGYAPGPTGVGVGAFARTWRYRTTLNMFLVALQAPRTRRHVHRFVVQVFLWCSFWQNIRSTISIVRCPHTACTSYSIGTDTKLERCSISKRWLLRICCRVVHFPNEKDSFFLTRKISAIHS